VVYENRQSVKMNILKQKVVIAIGLVSSLIGGVGIALAELGGCACVLAPALSIIGLVSIIGSFVSYNRSIFLLIGAALIVLSVAIHYRPKTCSVRK
jgi:hypothetical protein